MTPIRRGSEALSVLLAAAAVIVVALMLAADRFSDSSTPATAAAATTVAAGSGAGGAAAAAPATTVAAAPAPTAAAGTDEQLKELDTPADPATGNCTMDVLSVRMGSSGNSVLCLQKALAQAGLYQGPQSGQFDEATYAAVRKVQEDRKMFVDGVVGRETAISLGIWPDEASFVVRTPAPTAGAVDAMGYPLSSVSSTGASAPPVPANSGSGRRVVYDRAGQRVWAIDAKGNVIRSWLVSGSKYSNEVPGTHKVYSKSAVSTAWNGQAYLPKMIRYYETDIGHIGFHAIPLHVKDRSPYQTEAELGTRLSGGCQRQANRDAAFLWDFAQVGTTVVVT